jgi:hypothetical protein
MLTKINPQGVKSDKGFVVQFTGRFELQYIENDRSLSIIVEPGPTETIYIESIETWRPPFETDIIPVARKAQIKKNIEEALDFLGIKYRFE